MSTTEPKLPLKTAGLVMGLIVGLATLAAFMSPVTSAPERLTAAERRIGSAETRLEKLESDRRVDRELLIRIDENVRALKETQARK
jgi:hypothetical protein